MSTLSPTRHLHQEVQDEGWEDHKRPPSPQQQTLMVREVLPLPQGQNRENEVEFLPSGDPGPEPVTFTSLTSFITHNYNPSTCHTLHMIYVPAILFIFSETHPWSYCFIVSLFNFSETDILSYCFFCKIFYFIFYFIWFILSCSILFYFYYCWLLSGARHKRISLHCKIVWLYMWQLNMI